MADDDRLSVVIADDHAPIRAAIRGALEAEGFEVVGEAASADTAVALATTHEPNVCLLDIHMPGSGIAAAARITTALPQTTVVMLTYSRADEDLFDSLRAGARGYLLKDMNPDRVGAALRGVLDGEAALPRALVARVLDEFRSTSKRKLVFRQRRSAALTDREWETMALLRDGLTTEEVAERLFISPATVRVHVSSVVKKLQATDRAQALRMLDGE
jgi:DNA-binding NarL/FixJ family response regulator